MPHARMHHIVFIVAIVIIVVLTLCYFVMSHTTLILYYHVTMLTLYTQVGHLRKFIKPCEKECRVFFIHL